VRRGGEVRVEEGGRREGRLYSGQVVVLLQHEKNKYIAENWRYTHKGKNMTRTQPGYDQHIMAHDLKCCAVFYLKEAHRLARCSMAARRSLPSFWKGREGRREEREGERRVRREQGRGEERAGEREEKQEERAWRGERSKRREKGEERAGGRREKGE
jgi:hypothetical protein